MSRFCIVGWACIDAASRPLVRRKTKQALGYDKDVGRQGLVIAASELMTAASQFARLPSS